LFVLIVIITGGPKLLQAAQKPVEKIIKSVKFGGEELKAEKPTLPEEHQTAVDKLVRTINIMLRSPEKECFMNYKVKDYGTRGLPEFGEEGTSLEFALSDGRTLLTIRGGIQGGHIVDQISFSGMKPCVISGESKTTSVAALFDGKILDNLDIKEGYYKPVDIITIAFEAPWFDTNENRIRYEKEWLDFEDGGYLFKAENNHICFFPTNDGGINDEGLNKHLLYDEKVESSIPSLLNKGKITRCSG